MVGLGQPCCPPEEQGRYGHQDVADASLTALAARLTQLFK